MKSLRDIRVIPVVLVAIAGLTVLKVAGLVIDGGYVFDYQVPSGKTSMPSGISMGTATVRQVLPSSREIATRLACRPSSAAAPTVPQTATAPLVAAASIRG